VELLRDARNFDFTKITGSEGVKLSSQSLSCVRLDMKITCSIAPSSTISGVSALAKGFCLAAFGNTYQNKNRYSAGFLKT